MDFWMSRIGNVLQEPKTVHCALIICLTTSTIKIIVGIVERVFITVVNCNAWIKRGKLLSSELNLPAFSEYGEIHLARKKTSCKFWLFSPEFTVCVMLILFYNFLRITSACFTLWLRCLYAFIKKCFSRV